MKLLLGSHFSGCWSASRASPRWQCLSGEFLSSPRSRSTALTRRIQAFVTSSYQAGSLRPLLDDVADWTPASITRSTFFASPRSPVANRVLRCPRSRSLLADMAWRELASIATCTPRPALSAVGRRSQAHRTEGVDMPSRSMTVSVAIPR